MPAEPSYNLPIIVGHTIYALKDGGMERGLVNLVNHGQKDRFRHVILCLTEAGEFARQLQPSSCRVIEFRKKPGNDLRLALRIAQVVREFNVAILHARGWPTLVETAIAARMARVRKTIYGFHGRTMDSLAGIGVTRRITQAIVLRTYDHVVTLNPRMRTELAKEAYMREDSIEVIPNGVDGTTFRPCLDRAMCRKRFGLPLNRTIIGNIARLDPVKNHEVILRAIACFRPGPTRPYFLLVGEGEHRPVLESAIRRMGLELDVNLMGFSNQISELLNCMDIYVQSSFYEGFSNTILEAMACGLPILATNVGGTKDLFVEGQEGFLFQPDHEIGLASLIRTLLDSHNLREAMGKCARMRAAECFSLEKMVRSYESMYLHASS